MNQAELRIMAEERLKDASALIEGCRWEFAYYASGYVIECALKSCVLARMIYTAWIFDDKREKNAKECRTHDFSKLLELAELKDQLDAEIKASAAAGDEFAANWGIVIEWKETSRYEARSETDAKRLFTAIADEQHGVLRWIRTYW